VAKQKRKEPRSIAPRIHQVQGKRDKDAHRKIRTDYDQKLWPPPKVEGHGTG
jgi:hypothetical protein